MLNIDKSKRKEDEMPHYEHPLTISSLTERLKQKVTRYTHSSKEFYSTLRASIDHIEEEEKTGKRIQSRLLPEEVERFHNYEFSRCLLSSMCLSGDFLDYFHINNKNLGFYMADVSGHGVSSGYVTILLNIMITDILSRYRSGEESSILDPHLLLKELNEMFLKEKLDKYFTIFYGVINTEKNILSFANGGQFPWPVISSEEGSRVIHIHSRCAPVGLFKSTRYRQQVVELPDEFTMLLVSDGILEILPQKRIKEKQIYIESLMMDMDIDIKEVLNKLNMEEGKELPDDITFLMIKRRRKFSGR